MGPQWGYIEVTASDNVQRTTKSSRMAEKRQKLCYTRAWVPPKGSPVQRVGGPGLQACHRAAGTPFRISSWGEGRERVSRISSVRDGSGPAAPADAPTRSRPKSYAQTGSGRAPINNAPRLHNAANKNEDAVIPTTLRQARNVYRPFLDRAQ